jgi:hypothetical protein
LDLEGEFSEYLEKHKCSFHDIKKKSKLLTDLLQVNQEADTHHIDFIIPENDPAKINEFIQFIGKEYLLQKISTLGKSVNDWYEALRDFVLVER